MPRDYNHDVPPPGFSLLNHRADQHFDRSMINRWVPRCSHWSLELNNKQFPIGSITPRILRHYWLQQHRSSSGTLYRSNRILIPFDIPIGYCTPRVWRLFWSLALPHKVFTCWWRLLKDSISTRLYFHTLNPSYWPSSLCALCHNVPESTHHFFVSCVHKWSFWQAASQRLGLSHILDCINSVWCILTSLHDLQGQPVDSEILVKIGCILNVLWLSHWHCVPRGQEWSQSAALAMLSSIPSIAIILEAPTAEA